MLFFHQRARNSVELLCRNSYILTSSELVKGEVRGSRIEIIGHNQKKHDYALITLDCVPIVASEPRRVKGSKTLESSTKPANNANWTLEKLPLFGSHSRKSTSFMTKTHDLLPFGFAFKFKYFVQLAEACPNNHWHRSFVSRPRCPLRALFLCS